MNKFKVLAVVVGLSLSMTLSGCSGGAAKAANVSACAKANKELKSTAEVVTSLKGLYSSHLLDSLPSFRAVYGDTAANLSKIADSAKGDVQKNLIEASDAASLVSDGFSSIDSVDNLSSSLDAWRALAGDGGKLDEVCQSIGAKPFNTGQDS